MNRELKTKFETELRQKYNENESNFWIWLKWQRKTLFYKWIIKHWFKDCKTILDVGAGNGKFVELAQKYGKEVIGIDINKDRAKHPLIKNMDFRDIDFKVDGVFNMMVLEHIDQFEFMEIMKKYCKKRLITVTYYPVKSFWQSPDHTRPYLPITLKRLYLAYDFKPIFAHRITYTTVMAVGDKINII